MRFCIAQSHKQWPSGKTVWRVFDNEQLKFAEPVDVASTKDSARKRAAAMNGGSTSYGKLVLA